MTPRPREGGRRSEPDARALRQPLNLLARGGCDIYIYICIYVTALMYISLSIYIYIYVHLSIYLSLSLYIYIYM